MGISQKSIAQQLGVSTMTVSRVLSDKCGNMVSAQLKEKILEIARAGNYQVNTMARAMRTGEIPIAALCLYLPEAEVHSEVYRAYWMDLLGCFTKKFSECGLETLFVTFSTLDELKKRLDVLSRSRLIGYVVANLIPDEELKFHEIEAVRALNLPYVILGDPEDISVPCVMMDNSNVPDLILTRLQKKGAAKLLYYFLEEPFPAAEDIADPSCFFQVPSLNSKNVLAESTGISPERIVIVNGDRSMLYGAGGFWVNTHTEKRCDNVYRLLKCQIAKQPLPPELKRITITTADIQEITVK